MKGLCAQGVQICFHGRAVVDDVSVQFRRGRVTALLGPNGAGKSTLLACLAGLRRPDRGVVFIDGVDVACLHPRERAQRIGLLPQLGEVHWDVDVRTLVSLGRLPHRGRWGEQLRDASAIDNAMAAADVSQFASRSAKQLSGGERSRALLARVLAGEPEWLLVDEPLASLDLAHQLDVLALLRSVAAKGAGVVVVLHDLSHAARVADDVLLLKAGKVVAQGEREAVLKIEHLRATFEVDVHIGSAAEGESFVIPLRRWRS
jgi:iron complex transport system ATP-binding protein